MQQRLRKGEGGRSALAAEDAWSLRLATRGRWFATSVGCRIALGDKLSAGSQLHVAMRTVRATRRLGHRVGSDPVSCALQLWIKCTSTFAPG